MSRPKVSKNEEVELTALLEKCTQIMKEDRNILRTSLKEASNEELILLLRKHKKKLDLPSLQIEIRKVLNKIKGKTPSQSSLPQPSQQTLEKKPQSSKTNIKPPEKPVEKSPEPKLLLPPGTGKREEKKEHNESPPKKQDPKKQPEKQKKQDTLEKKFDGPEKKKEPQITGNEKNIIEEKKSTPKQEKDAPNKDKNPIPQEKTQPNSEKQPISEESKNKTNEQKTNVKTAKQETSQEKTGKLPENVIEFIEKKQQKPLKKMDQLDEVIREPTEKYETPSFKAQQQATFRPSLPEKKQILPNHLIIKPNPQALSYIENARDKLENQVDLLLKMPDIGEFHGQKIELFKESDTYNLADFRLPSEITASLEKKVNVHEEKAKKAEQHQIVSPSKSELSMQSSRGHQYRPSVMRTIKFITEKPNINPKVVQELQRTLGLGEFPPEVVFDRIIGDVHLSRTSRTYFKYKIEVLVANRDPSVHMNAIDRFFEICDLKQDGFIDLNELGFTLQILCKGVMKPNAIRHIYETFDQKNIGYFKEEDFVIGLVNLHEKFGEVVEENGLRSLFAHLDEDQKGILTYWDLYFLKNNELMEELKEVCGIEETA